MQKTNLSFRKHFIFRLLKTKTTKKFEEKLMILTKFIMILNLLSHTLK